MEFYDDEAWSEECNESWKGKEDYDFRHDFEYYSLLNPENDEKSDLEYRLGKVFL
jgi:hypothetical protein